ncbi:MAG TPA: tRNA (adenosine(37)-N6)-dimethylallyltransferase MiaA [Geminicoccus sp.]|uniref:tRNA (adenosine(37)-N6)-dimethylallyltransferase MiaA n=1 Tax=Geminicoccus sp. TaxID=2024832 RepID=UPI002BB486D6|nr:tRNA (adenosine(37)-N6)-dimethylallyltransferase MiaA [Geminicoccus sp.]HWL66955.1 tRNA (adenosine(37)-N6)-dimethylallyltransferase MiaA [Geminicoccus sp.]
MLRCNMKRPVIVIGGPTASGKSALAIRLAQALGGTVVNADSMQLYRDLPILTARPSPADERLAPHALYGIWNPLETGSAGRWLGLLADLLEREPDAPLVITGGTGLYLEALLHGIAAVPDIPADIRAEVRSLPPAALHRILSEEDPAMAVRLRSTDPQRLMRALEVRRATGRSLLAWHADPPARIDIGVEPEGVALLPARDELVARIGRRLDQMLAAGALDELAAFLAEPAHADSPLLKAVGVPEFARCITDVVPPAEALAAAVISTRQYAKRQVTFLRHRLRALQPCAGFGDDLAVQEAVSARILSRFR